MERLSKEHIISLLRDAFPGIAPRTLQKVLNGYLHSGDIMYAIHYNGLHPNYWGWQKFEALKEQIQILEQGGGLTMPEQPHPFRITYDSAMRDGFQYEVTYTWDHLTTGHSGVNKAYAYTEEHGRNLVEHWNRFPQWKYTVTSIEPIAKG